MKTKANGKYKVEIAGIQEIRQGGQGIIEKEDYAICYAGAENKDNEAVFHSEREVKTKSYGIQGNQ